MTPRLLKAELCLADRTKKKQTNFCAVGDLRVDN